MLQYIFELIDECQEVNPENLKLKCHPEYEEDEEAGHQNTYEYYCELWNNVYNGYPKLSKERHGYEWFMKKLHEMWGENLDKYVAKYSKFKQEQEESRITLNGPDFPELQ